MSKVRLINLVKRFGNETPVDGVTITAEEAELTTLLGPSGCGKTTTLRMIAGLEAPDAGEIWIGDRLVAAPAKGIYVPPEKRNIGMVFQSYAIWPHMTAFDNVAYPLRLRGASRADAKKRVSEIFALLRLNGLESRYPGQLSGGQQQRVALGRAIVYQSSLLLLDEPLANLDAKVREVVRFELKELQERLNFTTIYVTHDQGEAMVLSDKVVVMNRGKVAQEGTPLEIYNQPDTKFVADFIGQSNFISGVVKGVEGGNCHIDVVGIGLLTLNLSVPRSISQEIVLCIRPEDFEIHRTKPGDGVGTGAAFMGRVTAKAFVGNFAIYKIQCGNQELQVQCEPSGDLMLVEGDDVIMRIREEKIKVVG